MTNNSKSLSLHVKFNGNIVKSLSLSPLRELYTDLNNPSVIDVQNNNSLYTKFLSLIDGEYYVCVPKYFTGKVLLNNSLNSLDQITNSKLGKEFNNDIIINLSKLDTFKLINDNFELYLLMSKNVVLASTKNKKLELTPYIAGSSIAAAMILGLIFSISPDAKSLDLNSFESNNTFTSAVIKPDQEKEKDLSFLKNDIKNDAGGKGKKHKFDEGKMGKKESRNSTGQYAIKGDINNKNITLAREKAIDAAVNTSILQYLSGQAKNGSPIASVFGSVANGDNPEDVLGGLYGNKIGEANGEYGLGLLGTGIGGGGNGEGTIGLGNDNTVGKGGGGGNGAGYGKGAGNLGGRIASAPDPLSGKAEIKGSLDKEIIRRVIKRNREQFKYCYEMELQKDPSLSGRVVVKFIIDTTGAVASSNPVGVGVSQTVDLCIANKIKQLSFPMPEGGGIVEVSYPFIFQSSGTTEQK